MCKTKVNFHPFSQKTNVKNRAASRRLVIPERRVESALKIDSKHLRSANAAQKVTAAVGNRDIQS